MAEEDVVVVAAIRVQVLVKILMILTTATVQNPIVTIGVKVLVVHGMTMENVTILTAVLLRVVAMSITELVMLVLHRKSATVRSLYLKKHVLSPM